MWNLKSIRQPLDIVHNGTWDVCYAYIPANYPDRARVTIEYSNYPNGIRSGIETNICLNLYRLSKPDEKNIGYTDGILRSMAVDNGSEYLVAIMSVRTGDGKDLINRNMSVRYHNQYGASVYRNGVKIN